ncbi:MAG: hypothetical protein Q9196_000595 [Gyalolechia fulgens]
MNDLSTRLLLSQPTGKHIVALNRRLDELEGIISTSSLAQDEDGTPADEGLGLSGIVERLDNCDDSSQQYPIVSHPPEPTRLPEEIKESSQLLPRLGEAMKQLQRRQEEIKLVTEDGRINALMDDEAELNYLKLKLRIVEIQTLPYVPPDDYDRLALGIRRWKADWGEVHRRQRRRRWERSLDGLEGSSPRLLECEKGTTDG